MTLYILRNYSKTYLIWSIDLMVILSMFLNSCAIYKVSLWPPLKIDQIILVNFQRWPEWHFYIFAQLFKNILNMTMRVSLIILSMFLNSCAIYKMSFWPPLKIDHNNMVNFQRWPEWHFIYSRNYSKTYLIWPIDALLVILSMFLNSCQIYKVSLWLPLKIDQII